MAKRPSDITAAQWKQMTPAQQQSAVSLEAQGMHPGGGLLDRVVGDVASYPGQVVHAAGQLASDVPGVQGLSNWMQQNVYNPLGTGESAVLHALFGGLMPTGGGGSSNSKGKPPKPAAGGVVTKEVSTPFDLSGAETAAAQPYVNQLYAALGIQPGGQATAQSSVPGLSEYLAHVNPQTAQTITSGLNNVAQANQGMIPAIQQQAQGAANAGMLQDLLNAARFQAIYKNNLYGQPTGTDAAGKPNTLGQLFADITKGSGQVFGGGGGGSPVGALPPGGPGTNHYAGVTPPKF